MQITANRILTRFHLWAHHVPWWRRSSGRLEELLESLLFRWSAEVASQLAVNTDLLVTGVWQTKPTYLIINNTWPVCLVVERCRDPKLVFLPWPVIGCPESGRRTLDEPSVSDNYKWLSTFHALFPCSDQKTGLWKIPPVKRKVSSAAQSSDGRVPSLSVWPNPGLAWSPIGRYKRHSNSRRLRWHHSWAIF